LIFDNFDEVSVVAIASSLAVVIFFFYSTWVSLLKSSFWVSFNTRLYIDCIDDFFDLLELHNFKLDK